MSDDTVYATTLLISLLLAAMSIVSGLVFRLTESKMSADPRRFVIVTGVFALLIGSVSLGVHFTFGHDSNSAEPMSLLQFVNNHPIYGVLFVMLVVVFFVFARRSWHGADN